MATKKSTNKKASKKKAPAKKPTVRKVSGVAIQHVKPKVLANYLKKAKLATTGSTEDKVKRFADWVKKNVPEEHLVDCSTCGGDSHEDFDECPFCGDQGTEYDATDGETALTKPDLGKAAKYGLDDLNKSVKEVARLKVQAANDLYSLGKQILDLYSKELWKLRRDARNQAQHTNWKKFCAAELGMSHTYAYKLMDVANAYTAKDMKAIGSTKLGLTLQVEEGPMREKLLASAKAGASTNEIRRQVQDARASTSGTKPSKPKPPASKKDNVTLVQAIGRVTIKLYARPKSKTEEPKQATKIADEPFAEEVSDNDVRTLYRLRKDPSGHLLLVVERRRA